MQPAGVRPVDAPRRNAGRPGVTAGPSLVTDCADDPRERGLRRHDRAGTAPVVVQTMRPWMAGLTGGWR